MSLHWRWEKRREAIEKDSAEPTKELIESRRILYVEKEQYIQHLNGVPKYIKMRDPVFEEEDQSKQKNEPSKSLAELPSRIALVDRTVIIDHVLRQLNSNIWSLKRIST